MRHLLVTNDFPPKTGGIQSYLWELWRRLPPGEVTVLTTAHPGAEAFDAAQPFRIVRSRARVFLPHPGLARQIRLLADEVGAEAVLLDPILPLGALGPSLGRPYALVVHGAEATVPGRLPLTRQLMARVIGRSSLIVAAGGYPAGEVRHVGGADCSVPIVEVPPGVDTVRFAPLDAAQRAAVRARYGLHADGPLVVSVSRLVPRKGMDVLIDAATSARRRHAGLQVAISGAGRDRGRLERLIARRGAPVRLLGEVPDDDLPGLYAAADVFALCCRNRWYGLEQEGFGIVILEAAAAGVPAVVGRSGGASEAVAVGQTGTIVDEPHSARAVTAALCDLLDDPERTRSWGQAARSRAVSSFGYEELAARLEVALEGLGRAATLG